MKLDLKSRWRQFGKLEKTFSVLVVLYFILLLLAPGNGFTTLLQFLTVFLALWILLRLARAGLRQAIWRLRNRLIVTYVLIAVVPILLIVALVGIGGYMLAAQMAVYVARNELDRTVAAMHSATDVLKRADPKSRAAVLASTGEVYSETYPRISLLIASGEGNVQRWGDDPSIEPPPKAPEAVNGFVRARWPLLRLVVRRPGRREISRDHTAEPTFSELDGARVGRRVLSSAVQPGRSQPDSTIR